MDVIAATFSPAVVLLREFFRRLSKFFVWKGRWNGLDDFMFGHGNNNKNSLFIFLFHVSAVSVFVIVG